MNEVLALITIMFWALVPIFWIPVHCFSGFFRRLGIFTYLTPLFTWMPVAYLIYSKSDLLLGFRVSMPLSVQASGWIVFSLGMLLQLWTLRLLGGKRITGLAEVTAMAGNRVIRSGPFSVVRHPTYVSHTMMFAGVFLSTGIVSVGIITLLDLFIINAVVIPLEDRELTERLGNEYREYRKNVPAYFPRILNR
jgi:protein-S-isoprenylcysteine O-methyltransferase Ste14